MNSESQCNKALHLAAIPLRSIAAGDTNRNYADICLKWDVILNGPRSVGNWPECQQALRDDWELSSRKVTNLRRFAEEVSDGDYVVLRKEKIRGQPLTCDICCTYWTGVGSDHRGYNMKSAELFRDGQTKPEVLKQTKE